MFEKAEIHTTEILPAVGIIEAVLLFRRHGVDVTGMSPDQINAVRRDLLHRHHPDRGGDLDTAQSINAAYDLLKNGVPKYRASVSGLKSFCRVYRRRHEQIAALKLCFADHPEWAWAGYSGDSPLPPNIRNHDFTDTNFIKKTMWELAGHTDAEYTIWGFDGQHFRGHVTVFGARKIFSYMADAMIIWLTKSNHRCECRAVFVQEQESKDFYLIYSEGKHYGDDPIKMQCSFGRHPQEDRAFFESIPAVLERLREVKAA